jgi:sulfoxide reductase heme-binding subunit YedZ
MDTLRWVRFVGKPLVFLLCLVPALLVAGDLLHVTGDLGANPVEALLDRFGNWGIRFVMITLAVTPLRKLTGWNWLLRFRRMLGLFAFAYVLLHFLTWFVLDQQMLWSAIVVDIVKRPFITLGFAAFLLLTVMAATSPMAARRRLGRRWQQLHYSVYAVGILAVWHYWWQVKADIREPLMYAAILAVLLGFRVWDRLRRQRDRRDRPSRAQPPERKVTVASHRRASPAKSAPSA